MEIEQNASANLQQQPNGEISNNQNINNTANNISTDDKQNLSVPAENILPNANTNNNANNNDYANLRQEFNNYKEETKIKLDAIGSKGYDISNTDSFIGKKGEENDDEVNENKPKYLTEEDTKRLINDLSQKQTEDFKKENKENDIQRIVNEIYTDLSTNGLAEYKLIESKVKDELKIYVNNIYAAIPTTTKDSLNRSSKDHLLSNFSINRKSETEINSMNNQPAQSTANKNTYQGEMAQAQKFLDENRKDRNKQMLYNRMIEEIKIRYNK